MRCPLVGAGLKITFAGFSISCLTRQSIEACFDKDCKKCPTGKDIKAGKYPKILPDDLTLFQKKELPKNLKSPPIRVPKKLPYGVNQQRGKSKYPFYRMEVGEVVFIDYAMHKTAWSVMHHFANKTGRLFVTKKVDDKMRVERIS